MTGKTVLECEFHDYVPAFEIVGELSQDEYQAKKAGKTSKFNNQTNMKDSQAGDEYFVGGWDTIELTPTKKINRNKPQITTQQRLIQIEKDRMMEKLNRYRGFGAMPSN
jgi:hypothetical protein